MKPGVVAIRALTLLLLAAPAHALDSPLPVANFAALTSTFGHMPPDIQGAVGPHHVVIATNGYVGVLSRSGDVLQTMRLKDRLQIQNDTAFDPTLQYASDVDRWVLTASARQVPGKGGVLVAVSVSGDPSAAWTVREVPVLVPYAWLDQPRTALTPAGLLVCMELYAGEDLFGRTLLVEAASLYGTGPLVVHVADASDAYATPVAVLPGESAALRSLHFRFDKTNYTKQLQVTRLALQPNGSLSVVSVDVAGIEAALGQYVEPRKQADGPALHAGTGLHMARAMARGQVIWATYVEPGLDKIANVRWLACHDDGKLVQSGTIGGDGIGRGYPSLAATADGTVLIGYTRFDPNGLPSAAYSLRAGGDIAGEFRAERIAHAGEAAFQAIQDGQGRVRWGDYSATAIDPLHADTLWTFQQFSAKHTSWTWRVGIQATAVRAPCGTIDCGPCETCSAGGCIASPPATECADGNPCTTEDRCQGGQCVGKAMACTSTDLCTGDGVCDPDVGGCTFALTVTATTCDDGNACTDGDHCQGGGCIGSQRSCVPPDACHVAYCDATGGCTLDAIGSYGCDAERFEVAGCGANFNARSWSGLSLLLISALWLRRRRV